MFGKVHAVRLLFLLLVLCSVPATAEEIWIKNRVFSGKVVKDGGQTWMELEPFGKALGVNVKVEGENVSVNGSLVRSMKQGETYFVSLEQVAGVVGAVVRENKQLGTLDVHMGLKEKGPGAIEETPTGSDAAPGAGKVIKTAAYVLTMPATMQVSRDAKMIKSFTEGMPPEARFDGIFFHKNDLKFLKGLAGLGWMTSEAYKAVKTDDEVLSYQASVAIGVLQGLGAIPSAPPQLVETGGQRFSLLEGDASSPPFFHVQVLARSDLKARRDYFVLAISPAGDQAAAESFTSILTTLTTK